MFFSSRSIFLVKDYTCEIIEAQLGVLPTANAKSLAEGGTRCIECCGTGRRRYCSGSYGQSYETCIIYDGNGIFDKLKGLSQKENCGRPILNPQAGRLSVVPGRLRATPFPCLPKRTVAHFLKAIAIQEDIQGIGDIHIRVSLEAGKDSPIQPFVITVRRECVPKYVCPVGAL